MGSLFLLIAACVFADEAAETSTVGNTTSSCDGPEICDGIDNDCDGHVDNAAENAPRFYLDADGDGFGNAIVWAEQCSAPPGFVANDLDCDDASDARHPDAAEDCNGLDDDCDGTPDDGLKTNTWYRDEDGDGMGGSKATSACSPPPAHVDNNADCNDHDATLPRTWYADSDGDTFGDPATSIFGCAHDGHVADNTDCDDTAADVFPNSTATEVPYDGLDMDCDGRDFCTDLNCDGITDLLMSQYRQDGSFDATSYVYYGDGTGFSESDRTALSTHGAMDAGVGDFNCDGYPDLAFATYRTGPEDDSQLMDSAAVYYGAAAGFGEASWLPVEGASSLAIDDLNADGCDDVVFGSYKNLDGELASESHLYWGDTAGLSPDDATILATEGVYDIEIGDINADGHADIAFCFYADEDGYALWSDIYWGSSAGTYGTSGGTSAGTGTVPANSATAIRTTGCRDIELVDLDHDGDLEIGVASFFDGNDWRHEHSAVFSYDGSTADDDSLGGFDPVWLETWGARYIAFADVDGDGWDEVVLDASYTDGQAMNRIYDNVAGAITGDVLDEIDLAGTYRPTLTDLDGDGHIDLVLPRYWFTDGSGTHTSGTHVYWGDGSGAFSHGDPTVLLPDLGVARVVAADIFGTGHNDLVVAGARLGDSWGAGTSVIYGEDTDWVHGPRDEDVLDDDATFASPVLVGPLHSP